MFLGVDVAGANNTWICGLEDHAGGLDVVLPPELSTLQNVVSVCEQNDVLGVAIDAQLSVAIGDEKGFRSSDLELRGLLGSCDEWVQSFNSMMAVPLRGRLLAEALGPIVGTILETHPRATLFLTLGPDYLPAIKNYKPGKRHVPLARKSGGLRATAIEGLVAAWLARFQIVYTHPITSDGALDAVVCATVAYLFHREPNRLRRLRHVAADRVGRGPFYVGVP